LPAAGEDPERDREIKRRRLLRQLGRGEVDHHPIKRPGVAAIDHRPGDPVGALADRGVGEADKDGRREGPGRDVHLDIDRHRLDPLE
jgi:hypothetical protein